MQAAQESPAMAVAGEAVESGKYAPASRDTRNPCNHFFAYRASSALFGRRFYLTIFFGEERRPDSRLRAEGQKKSFFRILSMTLAFVWLVFWVTVTIIGIGVVAAYLLKSALGINLFEETSFLHPFFFD